MKDNHLSINIQTFDKLHKAEAEIGRYENILIADLNVQATLRDIKRAFNKTIKQLEIDLNNLKNGEANG